MVVDISIGQILPSFLCNYRVSAGDIAPFYRYLALRPRGNPETLGKSKFTLYGQLIFIFDWDVGTQITISVYLCVESFVVIVN
jgi:hypothetical protein